MWPERWAALQTGRADESRRAAAAVISGRARGPSVSIRATWPVRVHPGCVARPCPSGLRSRASARLTPGCPRRAPPGPAQTRGLPAAQTVCRLLSAAERYLGLPQFARRMDPDGLGGVGCESTRVSLQARRVLVELNPIPKRVGSELDAVRRKGMLARRANASRRAAAAVNSGRAQACGSAGNWGCGARPGPPPRALHQRTTIRNHKQTPNDHHRRAASIGPPKEPHRPTMPRATVYGMGPSV